MLNEIEQYEDKLYELYDCRINVNGQYFNKYYFKFKELIKKYTCNIDYKTLLLSLYNNHNLNKYDMKLLQFLFDNSCMIKTNNKNLSKQINCSRSTLYIRIINLESSDVIRIQRYNSTKIIYLHPLIIKKWR